MEVDRKQMFEELMQEWHKLKYDGDTGEVFTHQIGLDGQEYLDGTPMAPPVGYKRQPTMVEIVRAQVRDALLARELAEQGVETFEEADDFDIGDDFDPRTPFENDFDPPIKEVFSEVKKEREKKAPKDSRAASEPPKPSSEEAKPTTPPKPGEAEDSTST